MENARAEDQTKHVQVLRQLDDLQNQKKQLTEKLNQMMKFNFKKMADSLPDDYLRRVFAQARQKSLHFDQVGTLMLPEALSKYDSYSLNVALPSTSKKGKTREENAKLLKKCDFEENKVLLQALKASKAKEEILQKKLKLYERNFADILNEIGKHINLQPAVLTVIPERVEANLREIVELYNSQLEQSDALLTKLNLIQDLQGVGEVSDEALEEIEKNYLKNLDLVKSEKAKRLYKNEIKELRHKLDIEDPLLRTSNSENAFTSLKLNAEELIATIQQTLLHSQPQQMKFGRNDLDELRLNLMGLFNKGIEKIEEELQALNRRAYDSESASAKKNSDLRNTKNHKLCETEGMSPGKKGRKLENKGFELDMVQSVDDINFEASIFLSNHQSRKQSQAFIENLLSNGKTKSIGNVPFRKKSLGNESTTLQDGHFANNKLKRRTSLGGRLIYRDGLNIYNGSRANLARTPTYKDQIDRIEGVEESSQNKKLKGRSKSISGNMSYPTKKTASKKPSRQESFVYGDVNEGHSLIEFETALDLIALKPCENNNKPKPDPKMTPLTKDCQKENNPIKPKAKTHSKQPENVTPLGKRNENSAVVQTAMFHDPVATLDSKSQKSDRSLNTSLDVFERALQALDEIKREEMAGLVLGSKDSNTTEKKSSNTAENQRKINSVYDLCGKSSKRSQLSSNNARKNRSIFSRERGTDNSFISQFDEEYSVNLSNIE